MANSKITQLASVTPAVGDELPVNRSGSDGKITIGDSLPFNDGSGVVTSAGNRVLTVQASTAHRGYFVVTDASSGDDNGCVLLAQPTTESATNLMSMSFWCSNDDGDNKVLHVQPKDGTDGNIGESYFFVKGAIHHGAVKAGAFNDNGGHTPLSVEMHGTDSMRIQWRTGNANNFPQIEVEATNNSDGGPSIFLIHTTTSRGVDDFCGTLGFDSAGKQAMIMTSAVSDITPGSEDAITFIACLVNGAKVDQMSIGAGVVIGGSSSLGYFTPGQNNLHVIGDINLGSSDTTLSRTTSGIVACAGVPVFSGGITTEVTSAHTLAMTDATKRLEMENSSGSVVTVPSSASVAFPVGTYIDVVQKGAGSVTLTTGAGVSLNARVGKVLSGQYGVATIYKTSADGWIAYGDLMA
jgi:hypothetical protein